MNLREQILRDEAMALYVGCSLEVMKASGDGAINGGRARTTSKLIQLRPGDPFRDLVNTLCKDNILTCLPQSGTLMILEL
jgi:hypothetical protein